ncbi:OpgC domain-containing protein [Caldimonas tepidiphila]|uniref:OpgC domain-containing protein n=1 Tax=Caldimonas tepidiphila TaxID=2315841 RepID=UPI000E5B0F2A|nr:OpgC domain-containing protein [Caldimonas tepidiphila]
MDNRRWELDVLRGLMLVLMALTHLPTHLADAVGQPFGHVSAAEGFVLLSAWMTGRVYVRRAQRDGLPAMRRAFLHRAAVLYACHVALLLGLFAAALLMEGRRFHVELVHLAAWFLEEPAIALPAGLALLYQPPLLDILPLYVLFMLASAPLLSFALREGWAGVLTASAGLWLLAQFGLGAALHALLVQGLGLPVPHRASGPFSPLAWQGLWVLGLWLGARGVVQPALVPRSFPRPVVLAALLVATVGLAWRHALGQEPFPGQAGLNLLFSKWTLGPLRLLNLAALLVLALHYGPRVSAAAPWLRLPVLETLGRAALPVFCAHVVLVVAALATVGKVWHHGWMADALLLALGFPLLWAVARASEAGRGGRKRAGRVPAPPAVEPLRAGAPR